MCTDYARTLKQIETNSIGLGTAGLHDRQACPHMSDRGRRSLLRRRGVWAAAAGFWLFVATISAA
jgi:hypothetical protein